MEKISRRSGSGRGFPSHMKLKTRYVNIYAHTSTQLSSCGVVQVVWAVESGYRHIDCAYIYENQDEVRAPYIARSLMKSDAAQVGAALKKVIPSVVQREELFITSKLWNDAHRPSEVEKQLDVTLSQLGISYVDLYLIHWPVAFVHGRGMTPTQADKPDQAEIDSETSLVETWKAMLALRKTGKVRAVGVSNFTVKHLEAIIKATGETPAVNQIEAHPLLPQDDLVEYCKKEGIHLTAYSPLGNNREWQRCDMLRRHADI